MIAHAGKFRLRSGEAEVEMPVAPRSDSLETPDPRRLDFQSSEENDTGGYALPALRSDDSGEPGVGRQRHPSHDRFQRLVAAWREECAVVSSTTQAAMHSAYQQIIGMGPDVLPLILQELERAPAHWFWALKSITGEDPVAPEDIGRIPEMTEAWLRWGRERGHL